MKTLAPLRALVLGLATSSFCGGEAVAATKSSRDVFGRWMEIQQVVPELPFASLSDNLTTPAFMRDFKKSYELALRNLRPHLPLLSNLTGEVVSTRGFKVETVPNKTFLSNWQRLYRLADESPSAFLNFLMLQGLTEGSPTGADSATLIDQANSLAKLLFAGQTESQKTAYLFNLANKYYDFCFAPENFDRFQEMVFEESAHPLLKHVISVMWLQLAGQGWKVWHQNTINRLTAEAKAGKTIKYIAGGSDIYQLLRSGVVNIINIDPQLPSQPKYYTNDWEFILQGSTDDRIIFNEPGVNLIMVRRPMRKNGKTFQAQLATGQTIVLEESETSWDIYDGTTQGKVGNYTLLRRFATQDDFACKPNEALLMSFNELYFICLPDFLQGWRINPTVFDQSLQLHVKQLGHPIGKEEIANMHLMSMLNSTDLSYIALGTCIN